MLRFNEIGKRMHHRIEDRVVRRYLRHLRQARDPRAAHALDDALLRFHLVHDQTEHRALAGAVAADQPNLLPFLDAEIDVGEDRFGSKRF